MFDNNFKISVPPREVRALLEGYVAGIPSKELTVNVFRGTEDNAEDNAAMICFKGSMEQIMAFHQGAVELWQRVKLFPSSPSISREEILSALKEIVDAVGEEEALAEITRRTANQEISLEMGCLLAEALAMAMRQSAGEERN